MRGREKFTRIEVELLSVRMFIGGPHGGQGIYGLRGGGQSFGTDAFLAAGRMVGQQARFRGAAHADYTGTLHPRLGRLQLDRDHNVVGSEDGDDRFQVYGWRQLR